MPGVNMPGQRQGLLDQVMKGVAIARDVYGIKHEMNVDDANEAAQETAKADAERLAAGRLNKGEQIKLASSGSTLTQTPFEGAAAYTDADTGLTGYVGKHEKSPLAQHVSVAGAMIDGKHGTAVYDPAAMDGTPTGGLRGFVETARAPGPDKAPKTREIKTVDESGKPVIKIVADEVGATYATPGGGRDEIQLQKDWKELGKTMVSGNARNSTDMGRNQATITNSNKLLALGKQGETQEGGLDKRQIHEAAIASANLVSSGSGTAQATIEALVPHTAGNLSANIEEWLTSNPKGVEQQAFVERMMETAAREKHLAGENIKTIKADVLQEFSHLASADPERWQKTLDYNFGKGAQFDEFGHYVPNEFAAPAKAQKKPASGMAVAAPEGKTAPDAALHPEANDAAAWAKANPKDPRAAEILRRIKASAPEAAPAYDDKVDRPSSTQGGL